MSAPLIIGLHGVGKSGKDTVGMMLAEHGYQRVAFADELKADVLKLDPIVAPGKRLSKLVADAGWHRAKDHPEVRRLLQVYGTEVARQGFGSEVWIERAMRKVAAIIVERGRVVITDVRFDNEAEAIRRRCGVVVHLRRPGAGLSGEAAAHASEGGIGVSGRDFHLWNDSTLDGLRTSVQHLLAELGRITR